MLSTGAGYRGAEYRGPSTGGRGPRSWTPSAREVQKLNAQLAKEQDEHDAFRARLRRQLEESAEKAGQLLDQRNELKRELSRDLQYSVRGQQDLRYRGAQHSGPTIPGLLQGCRTTNC